MSEKSKRCPCEVDPTSEKCANLRKMCSQAGVNKSGTDKPYLKTPIWRHCYARLPWLIFLLFAAMLCGALVMVYEETFKELPLLVAFIPLIMAIAGAGGTQVSTVVIRSMAVGEITTKQYFKAFFKEFWIALICGLVLGLVNYGYVLARYGFKNRA